MQLIPEGRRPESRFCHQLQDSRLIGDDSPLQNSPPENPMLRKKLRQGRGGRQLTVFY